MTTKEQQLEIIKQEFIRVDQLLNISEKRNTLNTKEESEKMALAFIKGNGIADFIIGCMDKWKEHGKEI